MQLAFTHECVLRLAPDTHLAIRNALGMQLFAPPLALIEKPWFVSLLPYLLLLGMLLWSVGSTYADTFDTLF